MALDVVYGCQTIMYFCPFWRSIESFICRCYILCHICNYFICKKYNEVYGVASPRQHNILLTCSLQRITDFKELDIHAALKTIVTSLNGFL